MGLNFLYEGTSLDQLTAEEIEGMCREFIHVLQENGVVGFAPFTWENDRLVAMTRYFLESACVALGGVRLRLDVQNGVPYAMFMLPPTPTDNLINELMQQPHTQTDD